MAYIRIPKDLSAVRTRVFLSLTGRQIALFGLGLGTGLPAYFLLKTVVSPSLSALLFILILLPFFFFAVYEKDGILPEAYVRSAWRSLVVRPRIRRYRHAPKGADRH